MYIKNSTCLFFTFNIEFKMPLSLLINCRLGKYAQNGWSESSYFKKYHCLHLDWEVMEDIFYMNKVYVIKIVYFGLC